MMIGRREKERGKTAVITTFKCAENAAVARNEKLERCKYHVHVASSQSVVHESVEIDTPRVQHCTAQ